MALLGEELRDPLADRAPHPGAFHEQAIEQGKVSSCGHVLEKPRLLTRMKIKDAIPDGHTDVAFSVPKSRESPERQVLDGEVRSVRDRHPRGERRVERGVTGHLGRIPRAVRSSTGSANEQLP